MKKIDYFGGCPRCGNNDGYLNIGSTDVCFCTKHRCKWSIGANLFSSWKDENERKWAENGLFLDSFATVQPIHSRPELLAVRFGLRPVILLLRRLRLRIRGAIGNRRAIRVDELPF